jgi:hypothetical protein
MTRSVNDILPIRDFWMSKEDFYGNFDLNGSMRESSYRELKGVMVVIVSFINR